jgi:cytochrome P450 family 3 subfamily A
MRKWLSLMRGQEWKDIRSSVTPAFTTGKIKRVIQYLKGKKINRRLSLLLLYL